MTYVAQFYHKFTLPDSGYDSTFTTSFKYSSSEEDNNQHHSGPRKAERQERFNSNTCNNCQSRRAQAPRSQQHFIEWKSSKPIGLVVSGGLELKMDTPDE